MTAAELEAVQAALSRATARAEPWDLPSSERPRIASVFVCFPRAMQGPGGAGDPAWVGAVLMRGHEVAGCAQLRGRAGAPYRAGLLALREGALLEGGVRALDGDPDVVIVDATGRDHPRGAGLALHLGARLGLPTVGVTDRPLLAAGEEPGPRGGDSAPLVLRGEEVGRVLRTAAGTRPLYVHAAWLTSPGSAAAVVMSVVAGGVRTPLPLREARRLARSLRALDETSRRG